MRIDRHALKRDARASLRAAKPGAIRVTLIYFLLTSGLSLIAGLFVDNPMEKLQTFVGAGLDPTRALVLALSGVGVVGLFLNIFLFIFGVAMDYGYTFWILGSTRGGIGEYSDLVCGFSVAGRVLLLRVAVMLLQLCWYFAVFVPVALVLYVAYVFPLLGGLTVIAALVGAVVVFVSQVLRYSLSVYCLIDDPDSGVFKAIGRSRTLMKGNCWSYCKLMLSFFGWYVLEAVIALTAQTAALLVFGGSGLLAGLVSGQMEAAERVASLLSTGVLGVVLSVVPWTLNVWLTPYITMTEAKFYDLLRSRQPQESTQYRYQ